MSKENTPRRILTPDEVKSRSKTNVRLAWILGLIAVAFFVSAWFIEIT